MNQEAVRVAAIADVHCHEQVRGRLRPLLEPLNTAADALVIAGDLTLYGRLGEARIFVEELAPLEIPVVVVLGNHDYEVSQAERIVDLLRDHEIHVLDGNSVVIQVNGTSVGFAGVKGFCGGFGRRLVAAFGEPALKEFVYAGKAEADKLRAGLKSLDSDLRVAVTHYAPINATLIGESPELWPFLGSSSLCDPIDDLGADVVFHGHAHYGSRFGRTTKGTPVYNVALPLVRTPLIHELRPRAAALARTGGRGHSPTPQESSRAVDG